MQKMLKQQCKIFLYLFIGEIPFCVCLHMVHTFYAYFVDDSWIL